LQTQLHSSTQFLGSAFLVVLHSFLPNSIYHSCPSTNQHRIPFHSIPQLLGDAVFRDQVRRLARGEAGPTKGAAIRGGTSNSNSKNHSQQRQIDLQQHEQHLHNQQQHEQHLHDQQQHEQHLQELRAVEQSIAVHASAAVEALRATEALAVRSLFSVCICC
jgi:hypothetical protein